MVYAISFNWFEEFKENYDNWENLTKSLIENNCNHKDQDGNKEDSETNLRYSGYCDECEVSGDSCEPMMNYGYPLEFEPDEEKIIKCFQETGLIVMKKLDTDECFLVLTGGGMDLSQQIARAYIICEKWIPTELLTQISSQRGLNVGGKEFDDLADEIINQIEQNKISMNSCHNSWVNARNKK